MANVNRGGGSSSWDWRPVADSSTARKPARGNPFLQDTSCGTWTQSAGSEVTRAQYYSWFRGFVSVTTTGIRLIKWHSVGCRMIQRWCFTSTSTAENAGFNHSSARFDLVLELRDIRKAIAGDDPARAVHSAAGLQFTLQPLHVQQEERLVKYCRNVVIYGRTSPRSFWSATAAPSRSLMPFITPTPFLKTWFRRPTGEPRSVLAARVRSTQRPEKFATRSLSSSRSAGGSSDTCFTP